MRNARPALRKLVSHAVDAVTWIAVAILVVGAGWAVWTVVTTVAADLGITPVSDTSRVTVSCASEDSCAVDYGHGVWTVNGAVVGLDCPTEDSCAVDYTPGAWTFTQVSE